MPAFEVPSIPEHGQFRATVGFELSHDGTGLGGPSNAVGRVRIEPPFQMDKDEYRVFEDNVNVYFWHYASSSEATILKLEAVDTDNIEAPQRIAGSVSVLLEFLGALSSKELFAANWAE